MKKVRERRNLRGKSISVLTPHNTTQIIKRSETTKESVQFQSPVQNFITVWFNGKKLLAPLSTSYLEDHPLSAVPDFLFSILAVTRRIWGRTHPQSEDAPCRGDRDPNWALALDVGSSVVRIIGEWRELRKLLDKTLHTLNISAVK